jgi:2-succinyl-5-enolpyruvyl-6-hydroxy-3-cyclohexene-1-carboxylate synthase
MVGSNAQTRPHDGPAPRPLALDLPASDVQATFCATLIDEWVRLGVGHAVVAPGSRSTPMAVAMAERNDIDVHVVHDERTAGFTTLGLGLGGTPALLLCTSGTAAANFFPAVVEAGLSVVPMIVLTADRPPELRGVGAPQTIDQIDLYGNHVRWFHDADIANAEAAPTWRPLADEAFARAADGPVQLNVGFREPLLGTPAELPAHSDVSGSSLTVSLRDEIGALEHQNPPTKTVPESFATSRGLILVGGRSRVAAEQVAALHAATGWPVLADPISGMRDLDGVVTTAESLLRHQPFADAHAPDSVVRVGRPSTSKTLAQFVDRAVAAGATLVQVGGPGTIDPAHNVAARCSIADVITAAANVRRSAEWSASWLTAESASSAAIRSALDDLDAAGELTEPGVARVVADHLGATTRLVVSSSMPVRDHEWFGGASATAHANRGANGIDGVTSTALGIALAEGSAAVLIGDLAFVHDSNALMGLAARGTDLRIVVVDNGGGGIFSFLPQATSLGHDRFEQLFGTPHGTDVLTLATAHGLATHDIDSADALAEHLGQPGPWVARVRSTRDRNVEVHTILHAAVAAALG